MTFNPKQFAEKYKLALDSAAKDKPAGGLNGFELEWNLLDELRAGATIFCGLSARGDLAAVAAQLFPTRGLPLDGRVCHPALLQPARCGV